MFRRYVERVAARQPPFAYGVAMAPVPGAADSWNDTVAGLPVTFSWSGYHPPKPTGDVLSEVATAAVRQWMHSANGELHVKVPLGPQWPRLNVLERGGQQQVGVALAGSAAGVEAPSGDPAFDARYVVRAAAADPVLGRVLTPPVRAALTSAKCTRMIVGGGMWATFGYWEPPELQPLIGWTRWFVELLVTSSGLPVIRPGDPLPPTSPAVPG